MKSSRLRIYFFSWGLALGTFICGAAFKVTEPRALIGSEIDRVPKHSKKSVSAVAPFSREAICEPLQEKKVITIGQTAALAGAIFPYQKAINNGIAAFIKRCNAHGGILGHKLALNIINNNNSPAKAIADVESLKKQHIDLFIGIAGSRNIKSVLPLVKEKEIALFFPWGVSIDIDKHQIPYLIHGQNVMRMHLKKIASYVAGTLQHTNIGIVHSDSAFGILNANYIENLLKAYQSDSKSVQISKQVYSNRQFNFDEIVTELNKTKPHAVISLLTSKPTAKIIQRIWKTGNHTTDFIGTEGNFFAAKQFDDGDINFYYSSAVPGLDEIEYPIVAEYLEASRAYLPDQTPNTLSLTYYINMKLLAQAIENVIAEKKVVSKETVLTALDSIKDTHLGGFIGEFNRKTHMMYPLNVSILKG
ncbi:hypothetical protein FJ366_03005 [Candidatus Dependentiae bacterium]|nr:hypothetical protein [Candidatus Dependentiae bacterium]